MLDNAKNGVSNLPFPPTAIGLRSVRSWPSLALCALCALQLALAVVLLYLLEGFYVEQEIALLMADGIC